jgi:hypothetical protein
MNFMLIFNKSLLISCSHSIFDVDRKNETKEKLRKTLNEAKNEARSKRNPLEFLFNLIYLISFIYLYGFNIISRVSFNGL